MKYLLIGVLAAMTVVAVVTIARGEQRDIITEAYQDPSRSLDTPVHQDIWRAIWNKPHICARKSDGRDPQPVWCGR